MYNKKQTKNKKQKTNEKKNKKKQRTFCYKCTGSFESFRSDFVCFCAQCKTGCKSWLYNNVGTPDRAEPQPVTQPQQMWLWLSRCEQNSILIFLCTPYLPLKLYIGPLFRIIFFCNKRTNWEHNVFSYICLLSSPCHCAVCFFSWTQWAQIWPSSAPLAKLLLQCLRTSIKPWMSQNCGAMTVFFFFPVL